MKITEDYLIQHGFKKLDNFFLKVQENVWNISIRPTVGNESWQLSVFKCSTEQYGKLEGNLCADNNSMSFLGTVTTAEQIQNAIIACGIEKKPNWRKRFPFFLVRGKKMQVYQWIGEEAIFTGFETDDYNAAMAEVNRKNKEHIRNI